MTSLETRPLVGRRHPRPDLGSSALPSVPPQYAADFDIAIVGLGYVGLPTALAYHHAGARVLGLEISPQRISTIRSGDADLLDSDRARLTEALRDPRFAITDDPTMLRRATAVIVCVPTPVDHHLVPDLTMLRSACDSVVANAVPDQILMLTSTSYVGCTDDLLVTPLVERGFTPGRNISVAFSPERIDPGNDAYEHESVPRVVGGATPSCEMRASAVLSRYTARVHRVDSLAAAEMTKLLENTFRAVNIALANEVADICRELDVPVTEVIDAAATKPYGFMPFLPGPGVGGHCIPCDPHYLLWQLRERRVAAPMITQAMSEIAARPARVVERAAQVLSDAGRGLGGARVLVVGVSYKPDVADLRESPALEIIHGLERRGAIVEYLDPLCPQARMLDGRVTETVRDPLGFAPDLVVIHTRHRELDLSWIDERHLVLDASYRELAVPRRVTL
ncbi:nucleotide sugar dehydrogenase [Protaetiibacter sp. SSC-01]|uniref:nucleotide sugar dehydrogenase n=1 Tax=Protaetiibacter sp. SSC-01 TaxID=2759943 RepID=UPI001656A11B|nr:nucleotide sugar dehydrogenase [Protaetiibacter sp. SSC-01]QNO38038.1 nucleotide sugar dehydrogenase [Protaetiibacter sp. SSC-01]